MGEQGPENRCRHPADDHGKMKTMFEKHKQRTTWLWVAAVLLFPAVATLMPVIHGFCVKLHGDCLVPATPEFYSANCGTSSVVGQVFCSASVSQIVRSRACHCSRGGRSTGENVLVMLPSQGTGAVPPREHERTRYRMWGREYQNLFFVPFNSSGDPVSFALTVVQSTVLLI